VWQPFGLNSTPGPFHVSCSRPQLLQGVPPDVANTASRCRSSVCTKRNRIQPSRADVERSGDHFVADESVYESSSVED